MNHLGHGRNLLILLLLALLLAGCQTEIQHGLNEDDANKISVVLERSGIGSEKHKEEGGREITWAVAVPKGEAARAMEILVANNLPPPHDKGLEETFGSPGMIPTATEEKARLLSAQQGELSRTIASIDGVLAARVHLNIPEQTDLDDKSKRPMPSASVLVKYRVSSEKDAKLPVSSAQIQSLVARAVQDLTPEQVTVILDPASLPGGSSTPGEQFVDFAGLRLSNDSVGTFKAMAAGTILAVLLLAVWIGMLYYSKGNVAPPRSSRARPGAAPEG